MGSPSRQGGWTGAGLPAQVPIHQPLHPGCKVPEVRRFHFLSGRSRLSAVPRSRPASRQREQPGVATGDRDAWLRGKVTAVVDSMFIEPASALLFLLRNFLFGCLGDRLFFGLLAENAIPLLREFLTRSRSNNRSWHCGRTPSFRNVATIDSTRVLVQHWGWLTAR